MFGQSDMSADETSNVTLTAGTNGSSCKVNDQNGIKVGTSSKGGDMSITVPTGTKYLHLHAAAWKGVTGLSLNITGAKLDKTRIALTADDGISNNSPFTLNGKAKDFYFVLTFSSVTTEATTIKFTSSTTKRFVVWGANYEVASFSITEASNNPSWGTVSKDGNEITASPADGYRVSETNPYTVTPVGSATVSQNGNLFTVVPSANTTITVNFEAIPTHTLTVTPTSAGTITVKNGEDEVASGSSVREGTVLTIIAAAGVGKKFNSWILTGATPASSTSTETTFTVGENDVTVAANFDDVTTYRVHWSVNGVVVATDNVAEGDPISFDAPESGVPAGYKFTGWVAAANRIDGTTTTEPTANYVKSANATEEVTYYAVLVDTKTPDELTSALTGVTGTSYTSWSGKTSISDAVYAGQCAGQNSTIQLRSKNSESGVITTTSGGKAKKVVIEWNDATSETRTLTIYGKNSAYTAATELYSSSTAGTSLGELNVDDAVNQKSVLNITGDYEYIGIRSKDGALYLDKISIYWNEVENYCTTVPTATINIAAACTDGDKCYGTYSNSKAFIVPADLTVYEVSVIDGELLLDAYASDEVVPANTGVLVAGTAGDHNVMLTTGGTSKLGTDNMLRATGAGIDAAAMDAADDGCKFYRLTMHEGTQIGFFWGAAGGAAFAVAANKAYLAVPNAGAVKGFAFGEDTNAISELTSDKPANNVIYDLSGRRVMKPTKGLYIMNGKKVVK